MSAVSRDRVASCQTDEHEQGGLSRRFACTTSNESHTAGQVASRVLQRVGEHGRLERVPERGEKAIDPTVTPRATCNCFGFDLCSENGLRISSDNIYSKVHTTRVTYTSEDFVNLRSSIGNGEHKRTKD